MAAAYVGMDVRLFLRNQSVIDGRVLSIDEGTQLITLENGGVLAIIKANGSSRTISTHHVPAQEISDLQFVKNDPTPTPSPSTAAPAPSQPQPSSNGSGYVPFQANNPHPVPSMAVPGNHAPPMQPQYQANLPSPAAGQLPMPPNGLMHHHHHHGGPGGGSYIPGGMPITQQQMFGMMPPTPGMPMMNFHGPGMPMGGGVHPPFNPNMGLNPYSAHPNQFPIRMPPVPPPHQQPLPQQNQQKQQQPIQQQQQQQQQKKLPQQKQQQESTPSTSILSDPAILSVSSKPPSSSSAQAPATGNQIPSVLRAIPGPPPPQKPAAVNKAHAQTPQKPSPPSEQQPKKPNNSNKASAQSFNPRQPSAPGPFLAPPHLSMAPESATEEEEIDFADFTAQALVSIAQGASGRSRREVGRSKLGNSVGAVFADSGRKLGAPAPLRNDAGGVRGQRGVTVHQPQAVVNKVKVQKAKVTEKVARRNEGQSPTRRRRKDKNEWASEDAEDIIEDFDIQGSLRLFDKSTVFSEIRESDMTDPETLLVSHNRMKPSTSATGAASSNTGVNGSSSSPSSSAATPPLSQYYHHYIPGQPKLGIREPVLDIAPSGDETGNDGEVESELESDGAAAFEAGDEYFDTTPIAGEGSGGPSALLTARKRPAFISSVGVAVPSVTPAEMVEIERLAVAETGPNEEQMIENGGRGVAMMVLQAIGGGRRIKPGNHNSAPIVVVLAGNNKTGAYALCAARHLANHEVNVMVCAVGNEAEQSNTVAYQRKIYLPTGGQIVRGIPELPLPTVQPVDLIVDALLGPHQTILDLPSENDRLFVCDLMKWANENKANVLSLDVPSGVSGLTGAFKEYSVLQFAHTFYGVLRTKPLTFIACVGQPTSPAHYINAKWTMAFGLPKTGLMSRDLTGELFLADLGIPKIVFHKFGRVGPGGGGGLAAAVGMARIKYLPPFGDKFLIGLSFAEEEDGEA
ncbi:enhancer of mRNA decapping [Dinochytrium kinnereticum]|nr:enhancer of mRNA decapping [Dinochytrium kinnereticum]